MLNSDVFTSSLEHCADPLPCAWCRENGIWGEGGLGGREGEAPSLFMVKVTLRYLDVVHIRVPVVSPNRRHLSKVRLS